MAKIITHSHSLSVSLDSTEIAGLNLKELCFLKWKVTVAILDDLQISSENNFLY